ncbi:MAG: hypothetical protein RID91_21455, partial [Azospirillaceae bacterium]
APPRAEDPPPVGASPVTDPAGQGGQGLAGAPGADDGPGGRRGTVRTSWRGLLQPREGGPRRKTLLGE